MITTNYKIKSEKANFSIVFPLFDYILSVNKGFVGFILLDPAKKSIIYSEENDGKIFFNENENCLYKFAENTFFQSKIVSCFNHFLDLVRKNVTEAAVFALENVELQQLELLQDLCKEIFTENIQIDSQIFEDFCELIRKLEENMSFPRIQMKNEVIKKDELFDEFLKVSVQESRLLMKKNRRHIDKRVKKYYKLNFTKQIIVNWLLYII